ncbi:hypothetical protein Glove_345g73 [Diversispora epigaea]|uniref:MULE transposase domain-containing protein n=1 Tax=Diversispora epigaea TaxID=1348612 RepID=A0A397HFU9_9GLOM|nr:hypothetical protein Glove_345g73 [Diversispora epigaea]
MGAAMQRKYLEAKFPTKLYTKLLESLLNNPMWKVAIKFDNNNTLTHLFWMTPSQLELWYQFSDIVVQDVTCKTNRYDMALSLFIILDENQNIRLVAQALLIDKTKESHEWTFDQINLATDNLHLHVIMTDADPAVHAAIRLTFLTTYPMHCTFHISQNLIKKLQKLLGKKFQEFSSKFYIVRNTLHKPFFESKWKDLINEYPEAQQQFTAGLHASSLVESLNAWIKSYIFNSNISLCKLANVIEKRQLSEDRNHQLILWKVAIPCISTQISTSAFMFTSIDKKLEEYLPPAILDLQKSEIYQYIFYDALQVNQEAINEFDQYNFLSDQCLEDIPDARQITASCMISDIDRHQITSMWAVSVGNKLVEKHFIILLSNGLHASSLVESLNAWIKSYIFNSNISLCKLANVIEKRQLSEDRNHQLILWKVAIPCISTQISTSAFMFTSIDKKLEEYLPPAILDLQKSEIYQYIFYDALQVNQEAINEFDQYNFLSDQCLEDIPDARQITASCMISDIDRHQITSMWAVSVGNKLVEKHFIILLSNGSHHCSCLSLINRGIVCRYYFQIMLCTPIAKFHLRFISSRWYNKNKDPSREPFLVASKFKDENINIIPQSEIPFLTIIYQANPQDSITLHERLTDIQLYDKISGLAHKVTMKATRKKDIRIIHLLENYLKEEEQSESFVENVDNIEIEDCEIDKENQSLIIKNSSKQTKPKGRPKGTKRIKASHEKGKLSSSSSVINKQYKCSNCGDNGHNK